MKDFLHDDSYRLLQAYLTLHPEAGRIIEESGGLRKLRWRYNSKGKRGGIRILYYYKRSVDVIYMIYIYKKSRNSNLTKSEIQQLNRLMKGLEE